MFALYIMFWFFLNNSHTVNDCLKLKRKNNVKNISLFIESLENDEKKYIFDIFIQHNQLLLLDKKLQNNIYQYKLNTTVSQNIQEIIIYYMFLF